MELLLTNLHSSSTANDMMGISNCKRSRLRLSMPCQRGVRRRIGSRASFRACITRKKKGERNGNEATYLFHQLSQSEDDS